MYMLPRNWSNRDGHESCGTEKDSDIYIYREREREREKTCQGEQDGGREREMNVQTLVAPY